MDLMDNYIYVYIKFKYIASVSKKIIECRRIKKTRKRYVSLEFSLILRRKPQQGLVKYSSTQDICRRSGN